MIINNVKYMMTSK